jgi:hypothetical protein
VPRRPAPAPATILSSLSTLAVLWSSLPGFVGPSVRAVGNDVREFHVVSVYEGKGCDRAHTRPGQGAVVVNRPGQQVTLFLAGCERVNWQVRVEAGTSLERVFLGEQSLALGVVGIDPGGTRASWCPWASIWSFWWAR